MYFRTCDLLVYGEVISGKAGTSPRRRSKINWGGDVGRRVEEPGRLRGADADGEGHGGPGAHGEGGRGGREGPEDLRIFEKCIFEKCIFEKCNFEKCIFEKSTPAPPPIGAARSRKVVEQPLKVKPLPTDLSTVGFSKPAEVKDNAGAVALFFFLLGIEKCISGLKICFTNAIVKLRCCLF